MPVNSEGQIITRIYKVFLALLVLCLIQFSAGCSTVRTVYVPAPCPRLPAELLIPTPIPYPQMKDGRLTYGASLNWNDALLDALGSANADKAAIQQADNERTGK
ncbi:Rz1-like lysis system protein LysC [Limnobaculum xujianqingii]